MYVVVSHKQNAKKKHAKQNKYMIVKSELDREPTTPLHIFTTCIKKKKRAVVAANILHAATLSLTRTHRV